MNALPRLTRRRWATVLALFAVVVAVALLSVGAFTPEQPLGRADPDNPHQVALGETVYRQHCASCHGTRLEGQANWRIRKPDGRLPAPPHDETGHTWHHSDDQLIRITKNGLRPPLAPRGYESDMPSFGEILTDDQILAVLAFIKSRWPPPIRARQRRIDEAMRQQR